MVSGPYLGIAEDRVIQALESLDPETGKHPDQTCDGLLDPQIEANVDLRR
jgi:hypothetical protein